MGTILEQETLYTTAVKESINTFFLQKESINSFYIVKYASKCLTTSNYFKS